MGLHDGHRQRKKEQFLSHGLDAFADHEALELLLFYAVPRKDTNPIAHALLDRFGSLEQVLSAPAEELAKVPGLGDTSSLTLTAIMECMRFCLEEEQLVFLIRVEKMILLILQGIY